MGYNSSTNKIDSVPVSLGDIRAAIRSGKKRLPNLALSPLVNGWSKYKPINNHGASSYIDTSDNYRGEAVNGIRSCGFNVVPASTVSEAITYAKDYKNYTWKYSRRTDGPILPHRTRDFYGYYHGARCFMRSFVCDQGAEAYAGEGDITFQIGVLSDTSTSELRESDIIVGTNKTLANCTKGIIMEEIAEERVGVNTSISPRAASSLSIGMDMTTDLNQGGLNTSRSFWVYPAYFITPTTGGGVIGGLAETVSQNSVIPMAIPKIHLKLMPALGVMTIQYISYNKSTGLLSFDIIVANHRNDQMIFQLSEANLTIKFRAYTTESAAVSDDGTQSGYIAQELNFPTSGLTFGAVSHGTVNPNSTPLTVTLEKGGDARFTYSSFMHFWNDGATAIQNATYLKAFGSFKYLDSDDEEHSTNTFTQLQELTD